MFRFEYRCASCEKTYLPDRVRYLCESCKARYRPGAPLEGVLEVVFDYEAIAKKIDRNEPDWSPLSAISPEFFPPFPVGNTPLVRATRLADELGIQRLWIKNDGQNPSGSLKDRASFLVVAQSIELGIDSIVAASTGNAASALAAVAASAGKRAVIYVPKSAPKAKLTQMRQHGAEVIEVDGGYDEAFVLSLKHTEEKGGLNRNTAYHPLTIEGKKTVALELYTDFGGRAPQNVVIPVGDGVIISGVYKGFRDLKRIGLISELPRLICVQAISSAAIHNLIETGVYENSDNPTTIADSIGVSTPSNAWMACEAVKRTGGFSITVTDDEILAAQLKLSRLTGIFAEPAAASTLAGLEKAVSKGARLEGDTVLLITGHGLKDIESAMRCC